MVQPEDIDSGHSNSKLGASSGRRHRNLGHLQTHYLISRWLGLVHRPGPGSPALLPELLLSLPRGAAVGRPLC
jgi:hypothetical protein